MTMQEPRTSARSSRRTEHGMRGWLVREQGLESGIRYSKSRGMKTLKLESLGFLDEPFIASNS